MLCDDGWGVPNVFLGQAAQCSTAQQSTAQQSRAEQSTTQLATTWPAQGKWVKWWLGYDAVVCAGAEAVCTRLRLYLGRLGERPSAENGEAGPNYRALFASTSRDADRDELEGTRATRGPAGEPGQLRARAWHSLGCLARNLKPADRGMGDGWQRPEASGKQVRPTTILARSKSKYLSLPHSLLASSPCSAASVVCLPRSIWPGRT